MTRTPLYFKRGTSTGPRPYRRMVRSIRSAWKVANAAEAKIQRVRELHAPIRVDLAGSERCGYCAILPWPCDTIRAIEGDSDD